MTKVRCKVRVTNIEPGHDDGTGFVSLSAVYDPDPESENGKWFQYTPAATFSLGTLNPTAFSQFEIGKEFFVDFTPVELAD